MAGHRKFSDLRAKMAPDSRARMEAKAQDDNRDMLLSEIRKQQAFTQLEVANALGIKQPSLSKLESADDMQLSTLRRLVTAMGLQLEVAVVLPNGGRVNLMQFTPANKIEGATVVTSAHEQPSSAPPMPTVTSNPQQSTPMRAEYALLKGGDTVTPRPKGVGPAGTVRRGKHARVPRSIA